MFGNLRFLWGCVNLLVPIPKRLPKLHRIRKISHHFEAAGIR